MKRLLIIMMLLASFFTTECFAQVRYYMQDGGSLSDGTTSCIVVYFNSNKSNLCYHLCQLREVKEKLRANANHYNEWGAKYVNVLQNNSLIGIAITCRYYQDTNNAYIYIINFPDNLKDYITKQPLRTPALGFSHDFTKTRLVGPGFDNPPLYNEISVNQLVKPLF